MGDDYKEQHRRELLEDLQYRHEQTDLHQRERIRRMRLAREAGASWTEIGAAIGMSRQAAHKRYGREVDGNEAGA